MLLMNIINLRPRVNWLLYISSSPTIEVDSSATKQQTPLLLPSRALSPSRPGRKGDGPSLLAVAARWSSPSSVSRRRRRHLVPRLPSLQALVFALLGTGRAREPRGTILRIEIAILAQIWESIPEVRKRDRRLPRGAVAREGAPAKVDHIDRDKHDEENCAD